MLWQLLLPNKGFSSIPNLRSPNSWISKRTYSGTSSIFMSGLKRFIQIKEGQGHQFSSLTWTSLWVSRWPWRCCLCSESSRTWWTPSGLCCRLDAGNRIASPLENNRALLWDFKFVYKFTWELEIFIWHTKLKKVEAARVPREDDAPQRLEVLMPL